MASAPLQVALSRMDLLLTATTTVTIYTNMFVQNPRAGAGIETIFELSCFTFDTDWIGCIEDDESKQTFHKESKFLHIITINENIKTEFWVFVVSYLIFEYNDQFPEDWLIVFRSFVDSFRYRFIEVKR